jgi:PAS domain S-box-containing protein
VYVILATGCVAAWAVVCWTALGNSEDFWSDALVVAVGSLWLLLCGLAFRRRFSSMEMLGHVLGSSPNGIVVRRILHGRRGISGFPIIFANRWAIRLTGQRLKRLPKGRWAEIFPGEMDGTMRDRYSYVAESGRPAHFEKRFVAEGRTRWLSVHVARLEEGLVVSLSEITGRKDAEERLRVDEELLEMTGRMTKSGGWEILYPGREVRLSQEIYEIYEVGPEFQPTFENMLAFFPPPSFAKLRDACEDCEREGIPYDLELEFLTAEHRRRWVRAMGRAEFDGGKLRRVYGTFQDITDQRRTREERQQNLLLLEKIAATLPCAVYQYRVEPDGRHGFTYVSERIRDIYGCSPEELVADVERGYALVHPDDVARVRSNDSAVRPAGSEWRQEFRILRFGEPRWILDQSVPEVMPDGSTLWFGFLMDVTGQKTIERQLVEARDAAEAASHAKSDFLAVMSHEIRTPMNGVLGFAELLAHGDLSPEQHEYVRTIRQSGEAMLRIINDILDYSRIEAGRMQIERSSFPLMRAVEDVRVLLEPAAREKGITLEVRAFGDLPELVIGDETRLRQVLLNLASNAVKFTSEGGVLVEVGEVEAGCFRFIVRDTGPGVPPEKLKTVFEPFVQADSSIARRFGGTGLGLTIAHRLVRLMGGHLEARSQLGQGSEFGFELPLERDARPRAPEVARPGGMEETFAIRHPLDILVAEDDFVNRRLIGKVLERLGYTASTASDGEETLVKYCERPPQCILMDMHMPGMDGIEATRRIRELEADHGERVPVFISALTANVLPAEKERCFEAGMDDYLAKPLDIEALRRVLERASARARLEAAASPPGEA